jgi:hypothetical protein
LCATPSRLGGNPPRVINASHELDDVQQCSRDTSALELLIKVSLYHPTH